MVKVRSKLLFYVEVLAVVVSLFLAGPSFAAPKRMYTGPERPATETALIRGATSEINIESCDGVKVTSSDFSVLPGDHTIEMSFRGAREYSIDTSFLKFTAEAGHIYIADRETVHTQPGARYHPFILDKTTGKKVSEYFLPPSKLEERLTFVEKSIKGHPQNADFLAERGDLLIKLKRYGEALSAIDTALSFKPGYGEIWKLKSIALEQLGRHGEAKAALENINKSDREKDKIAVGKKIPDDIVKFLKQNATIVTSKDVFRDRAKDISDSFIYGERVYAATTFRWDESIGSPGPCIVQTKWFNGDKLVSTYQLNNVAFSYSPWYVWIWKDSRDLGVGKCWVEFYVEGNYIGTKSFTIVEK